MSTAEMTAHKIYETYKLGALPQDVKHHLIILFQKDNSYEERASAEESDYMVAETEKIQARGREALEQIKAGAGKPIEELFDEINSLHPWPCK